MNDDRDNGSDTDMDQDDPMSEAAALIGAGRLDEARAICQRVLDGDGENADAHYAMGWIALSGNDREAALERFRRVLELNPAHARAHNNIATILMSAGDNGGAARHLEAAIEADPGFGEAHANLGAVRIAQDEPNAARFAFKKALKLIPDNPTIRNNLDTTEHMLGEGQEPAIDPAEEQDRVAQCLDRLRTESRLEFTGEYGAEITTFIPFAAWLKQEGHMEGRRVVTYTGMRPYYYFLSDDEFETKSELRTWVPGPERYWPTNETKSAVASPWHVYPDYRNRFRKAFPQFKRPILFVQNKFDVDFSIGPINYMPLQSLEKLFSETAETFDVVYSRPYRKLDNFSYDRSAHCDYPDRSIAERYEHVTDFEEMCLSQGTDYNVTKLELLSNSYLFVAVQGGGAHLLSYFGNSVLLILHRRGPEFPHAYRKGPYKYLGENAPKLLIAMNKKNFEEGIDFITNVTVDGGNLILPKSQTSIFQKLSM